MTETTVPTGQAAKDDDENARVSAWGSVLLGLAVLLAFIALAFVLARADGDTESVVSASTTTDVERDVVAEVQAALVHSSMGAIAVSVDGAGGVVLTGDVADRSLRDRAGRIATSVLGDQVLVNNELRILSGPEKGDAGSVSASLEGSTLTLSGTVADQGTVDSIVDIVTKGAPRGTKVVDELKIGEVGSGGTVLLEGTVADTQIRSALINAGEEAAELIGAVVENQINVDGAVDADAKADA